MTTLNRTLIIAFSDQISVAEKQALITFCAHDLAPVDTCVVKVRVGHGRRSGKCDIIAAFIKIENNDDYYDDDI
jgi:hypothetical protein